MRALAHLVTSCLAVGGLIACHAAEPPVVASRPTEAHAGALPAALNAPLESAFRRWEQEGPSGDPEHRDRLRQLATSIRGRLDQNGQVDVVFVCTHNSRRSHMAQLLGLAAARRKGLGSVRTFSGGTEATAFNRRAIAALTRAGFDIAAADGDNPHVRVRLGPAMEPVEAFSKRFVDPPNPSSGFIVVMTCSQADAACPFVRGAVARVAVPYEDPKAADDTPEEAARYDERVAQIGRDLAWVFSTVSAR
jgi:protein-tyrosine-phosphatase